MNARSQCVASHTIYALSNTNTRLQFTVYSMSCNTSTTTNPQLVYGAQFLVQETIFDTHPYTKNEFVYISLRLLMFLEILLLFGLQHSTEKSSQSNLQKSKRRVSKKIWWKGRWWWRRWLWTAIWAGVTGVVRRWSRIVISCDRLSPAISHYRLTTSSTQLRFAALSAQLSF